MKCATCGADMVRDGVAAEVYRKGQMIVSVAGIPAVAVCSRCNNAILEWDVAQQVEDLVQPLLKWPEDHALPSPIITITFALPQLKAA